jgi:hypothetical protein
MVFYCDWASGFSADNGYQDDRCSDALVRMFERSLKMTATLPATQRPALWARLAEVRPTSDNFGYGVADNMDELLGAVWNRCLIMMHSPRCKPKTPA